LAVFLYEKLEVHCIYTPNDMECVKTKFVSVSQLSKMTRLIPTGNRSVDYQKAREYL
jgi:hypothetical protein